MYSGGGGSEGTLDGCEDGLGCVGVVGEVEVGLGLGNEAEDWREDDGLVVGRAFPEGVERCRDLDDECDCECECEWR